MATCGYICPACEGRGFKEDGTDCDWCTLKLSEKKEEVKDASVELEEWIEKVHQGPCCGDLGVGES